MTLLVQAAASIRVSIPPIRVSVPPTTLNGATIVALAVALLVGILGPIILRNNTNKTIKAEETRQALALAAEEARQRQSLLAADRRQTIALEEERARLAMTLEAERARTRRQAIREVLNHGALILARLELALEQLASRAKPVGDDHFVISDADFEAAKTDAQQVSNEIRAFRDQLRLWFADDDEVVQAYDKFLERLVMHTGTRIQGTPEPQKRLQAEVAESRKRYLDAAREHLRSDDL